MITTLFFIQLFAFQILYMLSEETKNPSKAPYFVWLMNNKILSRNIAIILMVITTIVFIVMFGWMTGLCAGIVGLMGVGSLVVLINPFRYFNQKIVLGLYALFTVLEFLI